ncbi:MAG: hypothetical protein ACLU38_14900 [Dysosmobacter sp.]
MPSSRSEATTVIDGGLEMGADGPIWSSSFFRDEGVDVPAFQRVSYHARQRSRDDTRKRLAFDSWNLIWTATSRWMDGMKVDTPPKELESLYRHLALHAQPGSTPATEAAGRGVGLDYPSATPGQWTVQHRSARGRRSRMSPTSGSRKRVWGVGYKFEVKRRQSARNGSQRALLAQASSP